jgi:hypothetical protein
MILGAIIPGKGDQKLKVGVSCGIIVDWWCSLFLYTYRFSAFFKKLTQINERNV